MFLLLWFYFNLSITFTIYFIIKIKKFNDIYTEQRFDNILYIFFVLYKIFVLLLYRRRYVLSILYNFNIKNIKFYIYFQLNFCGHVSSAYTVTYGNRSFYLLSDVKYNYSLSLKFSIKINNFTFSHMYLFILIGFKIIFCYNFS